MKISPTKIAIRTDASAQIGTGHVMRCLALAESLRDKNADVHFICRELSGNLIDVVSNKGFTVHPLPSPSSATSMSLDADSLLHAPWLEVSWQQDLVESIDALKMLAPTVADWLIVDHYALDYRWETGMRQGAKRIMAIDDLADRKHDCDFLLDQNYFQESNNRYNGLIPEKCKTLLGPKYALLRPEFYEARKFCSMRDNGIARILVYFGGNDPDDLTGKTLIALSNPKLKHLLVDVVIGFNYPSLDNLQRLVNQREGTRLHIQPEGFTELMLRADLSIGAGGATTWERLCLGLPSLVITVAKNQEAFIQELSNSKYIRWIGRKESITNDDIVNSLLEVNHNRNNADFIGFNDIVDGNGITRVVKSILNLSNSV